MDVSKCFESIYTHSMAWATKTKEIIKEDDRNTGMGSLFGQKLDTLMQKSNKNETNGIIIGPEFSRIFAEIIFQDIDLKSLKKLEEDGLINKNDFEVCRYIDDIFIFAKDSEVAMKVFDRYSDELRKYNLHVNESKTKKYERPFVTSKSRTILRLNDEVNKLSESLFLFNEGDISLTNVHSYFNMSNRFIDRVKSICADTYSSYSDVSNYLISSIEQRVRKLIFHYEIESEDGVVYRKPTREEERAIYRILMVFINTMFHMYSVSHSVTSSYVVSRCCLIATDFLTKTGSDYAQTLKESIFNHILEFSSIYKERRRDEHLPLEIINLILITSEFGYEYQFEESFLQNLFFVEDEYISYFNAVSLMYYIRNYPAYRRLHRKLVSNVRRQVQDSKSFKNQSSEFHLIMDMMCCPYIKEDDRKKLLRKLTKQLELKTEIAEADFADVLAYLQSNPWFVNWNKINLFNLLEKKLLKSVY